MPRSIPSFLLSTANAMPDKLAVASTSRSLTFSQLLEESLATAESLREIGIQPGDRVGVCLEKSVDQVSVIFGILFANAVLVPILPRLRDANIRHIIENSGMAGLITDSSRLPEVEKFSSLTKLIVGHGEVEENWPNLAYIRRHIQPRFFYNRIGVDNAAIIYSSGSTGRPKGILLSHRNLADGADIVSQYLGTTAEDRIASVLSFNFDYGLNQLWQCAYKGCSVYLHELAMPNDLFALISEKSITALPLMPVIISRMFDKRLKIKPEAFDFSSLRYICSTGGRLSEEMLNDLSGTFPSAQIYSMFGLTEAFRATFLEPDKIRTHPTSIGKAIPGCQIFVMDESGNECPPNTVGELVQRGATVSKGYWMDPENTARVFRSHPNYPGETLVFSGDHVVRDSDGYLYFVARKDEMIKTRGFRVSPTEVEVEVLLNDDICDAIAFAVPNISVGEDIACAYTTTSGEPIPQHQLMRLLKASLPRHMVPAHLLHFTDFPITGNAGKFDRKAVKEICFERLGIEPGSNSGNSFDLYKAK
jgi:amino acid adenylation domain-containing protein